jgi:hypothetical protein
MYSKTGEVRDRMEMLRVKIKSLAEEARIIRSEEQRVRRGTLRDELRTHRVTVVRSESRSAHIAYGLIRGRTVERMESPNTRTPPDWKRIKGLVLKYGPSSANLTPRNETAHCEI